MPAALQLLVDMEAQYRDAQEFLTAEAAIAGRFRGEILRAARVRFRLSRRKLGKAFGLSPARVDQLMRAQPYDAATPESTGCPE